MNPLDPSKITQLLNQSTNQLDESVLSALARARQHTLEKQAAMATSPVGVLTSGSWLRVLIPDNAQQWAATGLLAATLFIGMGYWQYYSAEQQISDLDVAILTDELPIEALTTQPSHS